MKQSDYEQMLARASRSVQALNARLAEVCPSPSEQSQRKREVIRQPKPPLNKLETEALKYLHAKCPLSTFRPHAIKLELANGCWYTPDIFCQWDKANICYEVKGPHVWEDAIVKLKVAARVWPAFEFWLMWKEQNRWEAKRVLP